MKRVSDNKNMLHLLTHTREVVFTPLCRSVSTWSLTSAHRLPAHSLQCQCLCMTFSQFSFRKFCFAFIFGWYSWWDRISGMNGSPSPLFNVLTMTLICPLDHMVSDGQSALILIFVLLRVFPSSSPMAYGISWYTFLHISSAWGSFSFWHLWLYSFYQIWNHFAIFWHIFQFFLHVRNVLVECQTLCILLSLVVEYFCISLSIIGLCSGIWLLLGTNLVILRHVDVVRVSSEQPEV